MILLLFFLLFFSALFVACGNLGSPYLGKATAAARVALPTVFLMVCAVFYSVQTKVWFPVLRIFNERPDDHVYGYTQGAVCTMQEGLH